MIVIISGASGSGKSLLTENLIQSLPQEKQNQVLLIHEDNYYKDQKHLTFEQRLETNYDCPDAFEHELLLHHLKALLNHQEIDVPVYDYNQHIRAEQTLHVAPKPIIILEGLMALTQPAISALADLKVFVDVPLDLCLTRRLLRDIEHRGRTPADVIKHYLTSVRPMYYKHIVPQKESVDLIVPKGGKNKAALNVLISRIEKQLESS